VLVRYGNSFGATLTVHGHLAASCFVLYIEVHYLIEWVLKCALWFQTPLQMTALHITLGLFRTTALYGAHSMAPVALIGGIVVAFNCTWETIFFKSPLFIKCFIQCRFFQSSFTMITGKWFNDANSSIRLQSSSKKKSVIVQLK